MIVSKLSKRGEIATMKVVKERGLEDWRFFVSCNISISRSRQQRVCAFERAY
jgi:hypothetical protein